MRREEEEKAFIWKVGRVGDGSYRQLMVVCFFGTQVLAGTVLYDADCANLEVQTTMSSLELTRSPRP